jgi:hypothetical protein
MSLTDIQVPDDIWSYVAQFLPPKTLRNMLTVNRVFFEMAMDVRYREVHFLHVDSNSIKVLRRLKYIENFRSF